MRYIVALLLLLAAHFSLTPFAPAPAGQGKWFWPFAADTRPVLAAVGGLPQQSGGLFTPLVAGLAGLGCLAAALALFGFIVPQAWWRPAAILAGAASIVLYAAYFGRWAVLPLALDGLLLYLALAGPALLPGLP